MADVPEEVCAFCKQGEEAGSLRNTSDDRILAHYDCLLFSPGVITRDSQDIETKFDIPFVKKEIKRGRKLRCSNCKKKGATIGCNEDSCKRNYHFPCVEKAKGSVIRDEENENYIVFCFEHPANNKDTQNSQKKRKNKRKHNTSTAGKQKKYDEKSFLDADEMTAERSLQPGIASQTQNCLSDFSANLRKSGQTEDQPDSPDELQGVETILLQEGITYMPEDTVPLSDDQAKMDSRIGDKEPYSRNNLNRVGCCTAARNQGEFTRDEDSDDMDIESNKIFPTSNKKGQCSRESGHNKLESERSKTSSLVASTRVKENSRNEDQNGMQSESSNSPSESNRKGERSRDEEHDGMQRELSGSSSESSRTEESTTTEDCDLILAENTCLGQMTLEEFQIKILKTLQVLKKEQQILLHKLQQQNQDGDAAFATNLVRYLRKVPEDKKLSTQISILKVLSSVVSQQPMSISNPKCVPQQYTNPSSPGLSGQTQPPKP